MSAVIAFYSALCLFVLLLLCFVGFVQLRFMSHEFVCLLLLCCFVSVGFI